MILIPSTVTKVAVPVLSNSHIISSQAGLTSFVGATIYMEVAA